MASEISHIGAKMSGKEWVEVASFSKGRNSTCGAAEVDTLLAVLGKDFGKSAGTGLGEATELVVAAEPIFA